MALHGSASANQSPILFKGNNRALGINMIIHNDESGSMNNVNLFFSDGNFVEAMQTALLNEGIGEDVSQFPNLYAYFGLYSRNFTSNISINNRNGTLLIQNSFLRGELNTTTTKNNWINNYFNNLGNFFVNICDQNNRLDEFNPLNSSTSPYTEDIHGNLWSISTTPNTIISGTPGRYGNVLSSSVRIGTRNVIITASNEQNNAPINMINELVNVPSGTRAINGSIGELIVREYKIISLSNYNSTDGYDGVFFYGISSVNPYGYINFTSSTTYTLLRNSVPPSSWIPGSNQLHDMLSLTQETLGGLFKISNVFTNVGDDNRVAFSNAIAEFLSETL